MNCDQLCLGKVYALDKKAPLRLITRSNLMVESGVNAVIVGSGHIDRSILMMKGSTLLIYDIMKGEEVVLYRGFAEEPRISRGNHIISLSSANRKYTVYIVGKSIGESACKLIRIIYRYY